MNYYADPNKLTELKAKANRLPQSPGVYIMKDKKDVIIYIGKAKKLKNRVSQYFGSQNRHSVKVLKMVENVDWLIAYVCHPASNSRSILEYAQRREKTGQIHIVNLSGGIS